MIHWKGVERFQEEVGQELRALRYLPGKVANVEGVVVHGVLTSLGVGDGVWISYETVERK